MSGLAYELGMVSALWQRDLRLFFRQRSRLLGVLLPPLLLWLAIGAGIAPSFRPQQGGPEYMEYFFPGVILVLLLNLSITSTMTVIEDRRQGFLQGVLVAPGSSWSLVLGKTLGATTVALIHAAVFVVLAPFAGFSYTTIAWAPLLLVLLLTSMALTGTGFLLAWRLDSVQGYHVVMSLLLFPLWILSGAMFPAGGLHPALRTIVALNPMTYQMSALRRALYGGQLPDGIAVSPTATGLDLLIVGATAALVLSVAVYATGRRPKV